MVHNVHERVVAATPQEVWDVLGTLGSEHDRLWPLPAAAYTPFAISLLSLALTMELWQLVQASRYRVARAFLLPGLALQRLTTREPVVEETQIALAAVASVLERELI